MTPLFRDTITLLNRRAAEDGDGLDAWKATELERCAWVKHTVRGVSGADVTLSQAVTVRIPENPAYHPYDAWKTDMEGFTASVCDIVIHGTITEAPTPDNIRAIAAQYESAEVQLAKDNTGLPLGHIRLECV